MGELSSTLKTSEKPRPFTEELAAEMREMITVADGMPGDLGGPLREMAGLIENGAGKDDSVLLAAYEAFVDKALDKMIADTDAMHLNFSEITAVCSPQPDAARRG